MAALRLLLACRYCCPSSFHSFVNSGGCCQCREEPAARTEGSDASKEQAARYSVEGEGELHSLHAILRDFEMAEADLQITFTLCCVSSVPLVN